MATIRAITAVKKIVMQKINNSCNVDNITGSCMISIYSGTQYFIYFPKTTNYSHMLLQFFIQTQVKYDIQNRKANKIFISFF